MPGPYVQVAAICERVLQEADGVLTLVRVIDRLIVSARAPAGFVAPSQLPEGGAAMVTLVAMLKSDDAHGRYPIKLRVQQPSGAYYPDRDFDVLFEGQERGVNIIVAIEIEVIEGLFWFEIFINEHRMLTRIPLRLMYQRLPATQ